MSLYGMSYQARAEACRRRAAEATWPPDKLGWTELAQSWLRLAQSSDEASGSVSPAREQSGRQREPGNSKYRE